MYKYICSEKHKSILIGQSMLTTQFLKYNNVCVNINYYLYKYYDILIIYGLNMEINGCL